MRGEKKILFSEYPLSITDMQQVPKRMGGQVNNCAIEEGHPRNRRALFGGESGAGHAQSLDIFHAPNLPPIVATCAMGCSSLCPREILVHLWIIRKKVEGKTRRGQFHGNAHDFFRMLLHYIQKNHFLAHIIFPTFFSKKINKIKSYFRNRVPPLSF